MGAVGPTLRRASDIPRPRHPYFESRFAYLSQGDIFDDVPYTILGPHLDVVDDDEGSTRALLPLTSVRAMLLTPTCDFRRPSAAVLDRDPRLEPYTLDTRLRMARVVDLGEVAASFEDNKRDQNVQLMERSDSLRRYMYLPALANVFGESAVELGATWLVDLQLVRQLRRVTQLTFAAAQQLHYKIVLYETSTAVDPDSFHPPMD